MKFLLYYLGLGCIAITLFVLHTAFAYSLLPIFLADKYFKNLFVLKNGFDAKVYVPYIFGLTFAIAIVAVMDILQRNDARFWKFAISVAMMELIGIALLCYPLHGDIWLGISGLYYGFYLFLAIIFYFYVKPDKHGNSEHIAGPLQSEMQRNAIQTSPEHTKKMYDKMKEKNRSMMLEKIKSMYLQKIDYKEIALEVGRDKTTVNRIINQYKNEWNV